MSRTDLIADMLTLVRNASSAKKEKVDVPNSKINQEILKALKKEGFIQNYKLMEDQTQGTLRVYLKYTKDREKLAAFTNLKRISKPGLRVYVKRDKIPRVLGGLGIAVISTSKGILTDKECKEVKAGGEVICYAW